MKIFTVYLLLQIIIFTVACSDEKILLDTDTHKDKGLIIETATGNVFTGQVKQYHENKTIKSESIVKKGVVTNSVVYDNNGNQQVVYTVDGDKEISTYYMSGKKIRDIISKNGTLLQVVQWHINGNKRQEINYKNKKTKDGPEIAWYDNGQMSRIGYFKDGRPTGEGKKWDQDGNLTLEVNDKDEVIYKKQ